MSKERIEVVPPPKAEEPGFAHLHEWPQIERQLRRVARLKCDAVLAAIDKRGDARGTVVVTADTIIVASADDGRLVVLGQPPEDQCWPAVVRDWFHRYLFGKTHTAATGLCVAEGGGRRIERVVQSLVTFQTADDRLLDWYIATGEPLGKAGGYALQDAGSIFVERVEGSISNVVGLPLKELLEAFDELGIESP